MQGARLPALGVSAFPTAVWTASGSMGLSQPGPAAGYPRNVMICNSYFATSLTS